jgi:RND family efflux transporter MFP subunit
MEKNFMVKRTYILVMTVFILLSFSAVLCAQEEKKQGMPPAKVVVAEVSSGMLAPQAEFIGTMYFQEKSEVAAEVEGKVDVVNFDEGDRVKKGDVLIKLNTDLRDKALVATIASYEQVLADLQHAENDLKRAENLHKEQLISAQEYDSHKFKAKSAEKKAASLKAEVERLEVELQKTAIRAPYNGIVVRKDVDRGEWLSSDATAMTIAKDDYMAPVVNVPERIIRFIKANQIVDVTIGEDVIKGMVVAIIPKGDALTRTVPVKVGIPNSLSLIEGMEARVTLPTGRKYKTLIVPRDAVITARGNTVVYTADDNKASMIPVTITGYDGITVGIQGQGLSEGMKVVVKGNERLRPGQPVIIQE